MGSGSDFTAFQDFAGVPSLDMGFGAAAGSAVYHYHSNYDSFHWMDGFGDNGWHYHVTITKIWALLAASLIESPIIRFNATDYAKGLATYLESVKELAQSSPSLLHRDISFAPLEEAIARLTNASVTFDGYAQVLEQRIKGEDIPWWKWWRRAKLWYEVKKVNEGYKYLERCFLYPEGLDERSWFKHVVFAPGKWTGYAGATFPGLVESLQEGRGEDAIVSLNPFSYLHSSPPFLFYFFRVE